MKNKKHFSIINLAAMISVFLISMVLYTGVSAQQSGYYDGEWAYPETNVYYDPLSSESTSESNSVVPAGSYSAPTGGSESPAASTVRPTGSSESPAASTVRPTGSSESPSANSTNIGLKNPLKVKTIGGLIQTAVEIFSYIVIIFAVLAFIWVGLQYILARGNSEKMKESSKWLGYIAIGVAVVIGARVIISIVINTLESTGTVDPRVIQSANEALDGN